MSRMPRRSTRRNGGAAPKSGRMLFIIGTSSECGKTTFMTNFNLAMKRQYPELKTAAVKACGTGSNKDKQSMLDANYDAAVDFVDFGLVTTYEMPPQRYGDVFRAMLNVSRTKSDVVVTEIGGDFLEASAPEALLILGGLQATCVLMVNDAMGAMEGIRRLALHGSVQSRSVVSGRTWRHCARASPRKATANSRSWTIATRPPWTN